MWVYVNTEPGLFTVGHYGPDGTWHPDSDYNSKEQAADRATELNGGIKRGGQDLKLIRVAYGPDCTGLVSLARKEVLAYAIGADSFTVPYGTPSVIVSDEDMRNYIGDDEHSWGDVIDLLVGHYNWDRKELDI